MSGPRLIYGNSIGASAMFTISSSSPSFPRTFLIDEARKTPWRSASLGTPSVTIDIDLGAATGIRSLAIINSNLSSGTHRLYYGATSPATHVVTLSSVSPSMWVSFFATQTKRYWRLSLQEQSIASGFYQIGEMKLSNFVQLSKYHDSGAQRTRESGIKMLETDGGVRWRLSGFQRKVKTFKFLDLEETGDFAKWERLYEDVGQEHPFLFVINPSVPTSSFFACLDRPLSDSQTKPDRVDMTISLAEDL
jgi:hypothetical protein